MGALLAIFIFTIFLPGLGIMARADFCNHEMTDRTPLEVIQFTSFDAVTLDGYSRKLENLRANTELTFPEGQIFFVNKVLSDPKQHLSTYIADIGNGEALRIDRYPEAISDIETTRSMRSAYPLFLSLGIPVPKIIHPEALCTGCLVVENLNIQFTFEELLDRRNRGLILAQDFDPLMKEFYRFARLLAPFESLEAFHPGQIAYVKNRAWVLIDYGNFNRPFVEKNSYPRNRRTPFSSPGNCIFGALKPEELLQIELEIEQERHLRGMLNSGRHAVLA